MDYHAYNRSQHEIITMHADDLEFIDIEKKWPHFKGEPQNLKISIVVDGVNPFGESISIYLVWHVFVINNHIPP